MGFTETNKPFKCPACKSEQNVHLTHENLLLKEADMACGSCSAEFNLELLTHETSRYQDNGFDLVTIVGCKKLS